MLPNGRNKGLVKPIFKNCPVHPSIFTACIENRQFFLVEVSKTSRVIETPDKKWCKLVGSCSVRAKQKVTLSFSFLNPEVFCVSYLKANVFSGRSFANKAVSSQLYICSST